MRRTVVSLRRLVGSVRIRVTLVAGIAFAIALVTTSMVLLHALESRLVGNVRSANTHALQAQAIEVLTSGLPQPTLTQTPSPVGADGSVSFQIGASDGKAVVATATGDQVGRTVSGATSPPGSSRTSVTAGTGAAGIALALGVGDDAYTTLEDGTRVATVSMPIDPDSARLLGVGGQDGPLMISSMQVYPGLSLTTASSLAEVDNTLTTTRTILWYVVPGLVLLVMGCAWLLVGRALRPVHVLTARASTISATSLHERVPVSEVGDEVSELATTINSMLDRIETADLASRRLVSDASHELRTPITVMRTELEVARRNPDAAWDDVSLNVLAEVDRLQSLVDDLLLLARMSERGVTSAPFSLLDTVRDVAGRRRSADVSIDVGGDTDRDVEVIGDAQAVQRALDHVVSNAARHADETVTVTIDGERADGLVAMVVDDDGPGIAPADRRRVLQRFERLDEARTRDAGGSGLGLAVAVDVMSAHGGSVEITESPTGGARVSLLMPAQPGVG